MPFDPEKHHRRSIRLQEWDYGWPWWYFVTIDVKDRKSLLGKIVEAKVCLSEIGKIVRDEWLKTPLIRVNVELG